MQSPFRRLNKALRSHHKTAIIQSKYVDLYEMLAFLLIVPSIIVFQFGFVLIAYNIWISSQIAKGRFKLSVVAIIITNIILMPLVYFSFLGAKLELNFSSGSALFIALGLTLVGFTAVNTRNNEVSDA